MKKNKELKAGDKVWWYTAYIGRAYGYTVTSVKKEKTLVSVIAERTAMKGDKPKEIKMYGHGSSSLLSGYDSMFGRGHEMYTCDYELIEEKSDTEEYWQRERKIGQAVLEIVEQIKNNSHG